MLPLASIFISIMFIYGHLTYTGLISAINKLISSIVINFPHFIIYVKSLAEIYL